MPNRRRTIKACAVCGRVLDQIGEEWAHVYEVIGHGDHVAVPVDYDAIPVDVVCDFCGALILDGQVTTVPTEPFSMPMGQSRSMGNWAACRLCAGLIEGGHWELLVRRCAIQFEEEAERLGEPPMDRRVLTQWLTETYDLVRQHMTGPARPWQTGDEMDM